MTSDEALALFGQPHILWTSTDDLNALIGRLHVAGQTLAAEVLRLRRNEEADDSYQDALITQIEGLRAERDAARAALASYADDHLCHPAHTVNSAGGGVCVHCGRTLHADPAYEDALDAARAEAARLQDLVDSAKNILQSIVKSPCEMEIREWLAEFNPEAEGPADP